MYLSNIFIKYKLIIKTKIEKYDRYVIKTVLHKLIQIMIPVF